MRESFSWQVYVKKACGELNFVGEILISNIVIPPLQVRYFSEKLYNTKKTPWMFWDLRVGPTLTVLSLLLQKLFWSCSFCDIHWDIYRPKRTQLTPAD